MQGNVFAQLLLRNAQPEGVIRSAPQLKARVQNTVKLKTAFNQALKNAQGKTQASGGAKTNSMPNSKDSQPAGEDGLCKTCAGREGGQAFVQSGAEKEKETGDKDRAVPADGQPEVQICAVSLQVLADQPQPVGGITVAAISGDADASFIIPGDAEETVTISVQANASPDPNLARTVMAANGWPKPEMTEAMESNQAPAQDEGQRSGQAKTEIESPQPSAAKPAPSPPENAANQVQVEVTVKTAGPVREQDDQRGKQPAGEDKPNGNRGLHLGQSVAEVKHLRSEQRKESPEQNRNLPEPKNQPAQTRTDVKKLIDLESARLKGTEKSQDKGVDITEGGEKNNSENAVKILEMPELQRGLEAKETRTARNQFENLLHQIVEKAKIMVKDNKSTVTIQLKPEFLGKLHIQLTVEEGVLTARFIASNNHVKELLEGGLNQLKMVLENTGIRLERAEVSTDLGQTAAFSGYDSWNWQQGQQSGFGGSAGYHAEVELPLESEDYDSLEPDSADTGDTGTGLNLVV